MQVNPATEALYIANPLRKGGFSSLFSTHPPTETTGGIYTLRLDMTKMAALSMQLFGTDSRYSSAASQ